MAGLPKVTLKISRAIARTIFHTGDSPVPESRLDWLETEMIDYARKAGPRTANGLNVIFNSLQMMPAVVIGKRKRFTELEPEDQLRYLEKIDASRLLSPLLATAKIVLCLLYFEHPDVLKEAGVDPQCMHPASSMPKLRTRAGAA